jgi:hypothetical protein
MNWLLWGIDSIQVVPWDKILANNAGRANDQAPRCYQRKFQHVERREWLGSGEAIINRMWYLTVEYLFVFDIDG